MSKNRLREQLSKRAQAPAPAPAPAPVVAYEQYELGTEAELTLYRLMPCFTFFNNGGNSPSHLMAVTKDAHVFTSFNGLSSSDLNKICFVGVAYNHKTAEQFGERDKIYPCTVAVGGTLPMINTDTSETIKIGSQLVWTVPKLHTAGRFKGLVLPGLRDISMFQSVFQTIVKLSVEISSHFNPSLGLDDFEAAAPVDQARTQALTRVVDSYNSSLKSYCLEDDMFQCQLFKLLCLGCNVVHDRNRDDMKQRCRDVMENVTQGNVEFSQLASDHDRQRIVRGMTLKLEEEYRACISTRYIGKVHKPAVPGQMLAVTIGTVAPIF